VAYLCVVCVRIYLQWRIVHKFGLGMAGWAVQHHPLRLLDNWMESVVVPSAITLLPLVIKFSKGRKRVER